GCLPTQHTTHNTTHTKHTPGAPVGSAILSAPVPPVMPSMSLFKPKQLKTPARCSQCSSHKHKHKHDKKTRGEVSQPKKEEGKRKKPVRSNHAFHNSRHKLHLRASVAGEGWMSSLSLSLSLFL